MTPTEKIQRIVERIHARHERERARGFWEAHDRRRERIKARQVRRAGRAR